MQYFKKYESQSAIEELIFDFLDQCKFLFYPEQWNQVFLDFSKNDIFALVLVYRRKQVNMTEIAEYLAVPLNTVSGVVNRLEKKDLVLRERSKEDKRVVTIELTETGQRFLANEIELIGKYYFKIMSTFSDGEKSMLFDMIEKAFDILSQDINDSEASKLPKKIKHITIE